MRGNLLDGRQSDYTDSVGNFSSLDIDNRQSSNSNGVFNQRKTVKSWMYYSMVATLLVLAILCVVFAAGWAAANHNNKEVVPTGDSSSSSTGAYISSSSSSTGSPAPIQPDQPNVLLPKVPSYSLNTLMGQIKTFDLIELLSGIYRIALNNGGNRSVYGTGHNATVEYLMQNIATSTNLVNVERTYFNVNSGSSTSDQFMTVRINGTTTPYVYLTSWQVFRYSASFANNTAVPIMYLANACDSSQWPARQTTVWIISDVSNNCSTAAKATLAANWGAAGFIVPSTTEKPQSGDVPYWLPTMSGFGVSASLANTLISAYKNGTIPVLSVNFKETHTATIISNLCGDTPGGDPTNTVMVGGHSDGVPTGPGVNDDGSGSIATLALAIGMTKLMSNTSFVLPNTIKFCWFGAEELGLFGSIEAVRVGLLKNNDPNARAGSRAKDWAVMIDLDMLGSLNFMNHIYDANDFVPRGTPTSAVNGSRTMTNLFYQFFQQNNLPADSERFDGRSDYGPFLEVGIPAGGVNAGADKRKNETTRERYQRMTGWGGIAGVQLDQCYHKACDTIGNIHWGVYTNMTMSAAYVTEQFAFRQNLRQWINYSHNEQMPDPRAHVAFEFKSRSSHQIETEVDEIY